MQSRVQGGRLPAQNPRLFRHFLYVASLIALAASTMFSPSAARAIQLLGQTSVSQQPVVPEIRNLNFERVDYWVDRFQTDKRSDFETFLRRKGRYEDMIRARLRAWNMPEDLIYLAMIESGFNPDIRSPAGAVGIWQFIAETGRRYGLRIDSYVDERRDPVKSTDAALAYLRKLQLRFGSWYLAAAAYNTGENRIARIMREAFGREQGSDLDYYRIWNRLPSETRDYVPLMVAAERISESPHEYGFSHVRADSPR
jgi:membrane-bound lytic murein transglycosylase D